FDEIFFVDLPNVNEREDIFRVLLNKKGYEADDFDLQSLSQASEKYSGAEIEKAINNAMLVGFRDNQRKITSNDIKNALKNFKSLYEIRREDFEQLAEWADESGCVKANAKEVKVMNRGNDSIEDNVNLNID
ncbi:MAG: AAA family ATPase, partial [bacterium]